MTEHDLEHEEAARRLARPLRGAERLPEDFEARLMARLRAEGAATDIPKGAAGGGGVRDPGAYRRARRWLFEPRAVRTTPARTLLAAAALVLAAALGGRALGPAPAAPAAPAAGAADAVAAGVPEAGRSDTVRLVQFVLVAPDARSVAVVGDFNDWAPGATPLRAVGGEGLWTVELPLQAGRYQYSFIVNGERWVADPGAPRAVEESFGTPTSVVTVGERAS